MPATDAANPSLIDGAGGHKEIELEVHAPDFHAPPDVVRWAHEKIDNRMRKYDSHVVGMRMHLRDVNGPRGGAGITCHLEARLRHMEPVNVEEQADDLRAAIDLAIDRLGVVVGRHIDKSRKVPLKDGRKTKNDVG